MQLSIPYGDADVTITVPDERFLEVLAAGTADCGDARAMLWESVIDPLGLGPLASFAEPGEPVLVLVNDATRPTPTAAMLQAVWDFISPWELQFLIATGTHRAPSDEELEHIFGELWPQVSGQVASHDARDATRLQHVGTTTSGNEIHINELAAEAGKMLVLGSVESHYFAGYTGGRKIFLPGVSGFETIERNHKLAMDSGAQVLSLAGNPVNAEMEEALGFLAGKEIFAVLAVLDRSHSIYSVTSGDIHQAFTAATAGVDELFAVHVKEKADIVIAVATHPLDFDLYQAQKAIENGRLALKEGGILILVSACREGVGNDAFLRIMERAGEPSRVTEMAQSEYHLGYHKAARLARIASWAEIWAVVGVEDDIVSKAFMRPYTSVQEAVDTALTARPGGSLTVLLDAGITVPVS
jgi:nickel-dependent lactate racemase